MENKGMSESKTKNRTANAVTTSADTDCAECDTAARLGLSTEQGEAVMRDASRAVGADLSLPHIHTHFGTNYKVVAIAAFFHPLPKDGLTLSAFIAGSPS